MQQSKWEHQSMPGVHGTPEDRFWSKVDRCGPDECWNWLAGKTRAGYGKFRLNIKVGNIGAHRFSYQLHYGDLGNLFVLHSCDNKLCVNPKHLFLGTHQDNMDDMLNKQRQSHASRSKGEANSQHKLTEEDVVRIKVLLSEETLSQHKIADLYGVARSSISRIKRGETWK